MQTAVLQWCASNNSCPHEMKDCMICKSTESMFLVCFIDYYILDAEFLNMDVLMTQISQLIMQISNSCGMRQFAMIFWCSLLVLVRTAVFTSGVRCLNTLTHPVLECGLGMTI